MPEPVDTYQTLRAEALAELARFEAMPPGLLPDWQLEQLNSLLEYALARSPFYRERWRGLVDTPLDRLADVAKLPFTTKPDLRAAYPYGMVAADRTEIARYGESTGTTGAPTSSAITYADWIRGNVSVERAFRHFFGPPDLVFVAIPYELAFASYDIDRALENVGAGVVAVGTLTQVCPFPRMVQMLHTVRPTGLVCTPSRALRLFDLLREQGRDPLAVGLRTFLYVGETCSPAKLGKIAERWQVRLTTAYGSTETNSLGLPCQHNRSHLTEDRHYFEVVEPQTGAPLPAGVSGELVLTSLRTVAMPLLRYRTGDLVTIEPRPCPCGSPRRTLRHHGRVSEQLVVGGVTVNKLALEQVILATPGTGLYYAAGVTGAGLTVRVECLDRRPAHRAEVCAEVTGRIRAELGVLAAVSHVDRAAVVAAMDRMLKPGGVRLEDLEVAP